VCRGRRCRRHEHDFDAVLDEGLAGEPHGHILAAPEHHAAGAAHTLHAADTRDARHPGMPRRLNQGHAGMRVDGKTVDSQGNVWLMAVVNVRFAQRFRN